MKEPKDEPNRLRKKKAKICNTVKEKQNTGSKIATNKMGERGPGSRCGDVKRERGKGDWSLPPPENSSNGKLTAHKNEGM